MTSFAAFAVLLTIVAVSQAGVEEEMAKAKELLTECKAETGATEDVDELMKTREIPKTHEGKCMVACALSKKGAIKNDSIDVEAISKYIEKRFKDDKEKQDQLAKVLAKCALIDVKGLDKCETAVAYIQCGKDSGLQM